MNDNCVVITTVWTHLQMFKIQNLQCWILLINKPVLGGVGGSLHFTLPFMNRLNHTEPASFAILLFWAFFRGSFSWIFLYWIGHIFLCFPKSINMPHLPFCCFGPSLGVLFPEFFFIGLVIFSYVFLNPLICLICH